MTVELIDGRAGKPHISGDDLGNFKAGFVGIEGYVLETENKLAATLESANKLTIDTGAAIMPTTGRHVRITSPETVTIQSGTQGQKRNDLVVLRTTTSSDNTTVETASIVVIKGTPTTGTPTDPSITNGDLKLYRLSLDGISVGNPVPLFNVLTPLATIGASVDQLNSKPKLLWSGSVSSGSFTVNDVHKYNVLLIRTANGTGISFKVNSSHTFSIGTTNTAGNTYLDYIVLSVGTNKLTFGSNYSSIHNVVTDNWIKLGSNNKATISAVFGLLQTGAHQESGQSKNTVTAMLNVLVCGDEP